MAREDDVTLLKDLLREDDYPMLSESILNWLLDTYGDVETAAYWGAIRKSENTTLHITGLTTADTSKYFKDLASTFRPNNSGILG